MSKWMSGWVSERGDVWTAAGGDVGTNGSDLHVKVKSSQVGARADLSCAHLTAAGWVGNDTRRESNNEDNDNDNDKRGSEWSGRDDGGGGVCTRTESRIPGAVEAAAVLGAGAGADTGAGAGCSSCVAVCVAALTDVMFRGPGGRVYQLSNRSGVCCIWAWVGLGWLRRRPAAAAWETVMLTMVGIGGSLGVDGRQTVDGQMGGRKLEEAAETAERTGGICVAWELVDVCLQRE